jgi:hypothetical protein
MMNVEEQIYGREGQMPGILFCLWVKVHHMELPLWHWLGCGLQAFAQGLIVFAFPTSLFSCAVELDSA